VLASQLDASKARYEKSAQELASTAAALEEIHAKNEQLRKFMLVNFSRSDFHYVDPASIVVPAEEPVANVLVEKALTAVANVAVDVAEEADAVEEVGAATPGKGPWWKFWGKKETLPREPSIDLTTYKRALNAMDEKASAKEAMRLMNAQMAGAPVEVLAKHLIEDALATEDALMVKWVSAGVVKGAGDQKDVVEEIIADSVEGTPYKGAVAQLLGL